ncbi:MAG: HAMP domain-containing sensor histidine kinase [Methylotetracoccus sp.]
MKSLQRINRRLARAFILQLALISLTALLGIYAAKSVLEDILIQQALRDEADYFWQRRARDPHAGLPNTRNMTGFLQPALDPETIPGELRGLAPGFHRLQSGSAFAAAYVSESVGERLILVFDGSRVEELAVFFGMAPLAIVLIVLYSAALITYWTARRAVSPVIRLAEDVERIDLQSPDQGLIALETRPASSEPEVQALSSALADLARRIRHFIERERTFTRDVSHELRSPITVIRVAADMLLGDTRLDPGLRDKAARIRRASAQMEELTAAFLLLAREAESGPREAFECVNDVVAEQFELVRPLLAGKPVQLCMQASGRLFVAGSEKVLSVLIGNLLRNACSYTASGEVRVIIEPRRLTVEDSGSGIPQEQIERVFEPFYRGSASGEGHGVGLAVVKRLSERFDWPVSLHSDPGRGTRAHIDFPRSRFDALDSPPENE